MKLAIFQDKSLNGIDNKNVKRCCPKSLIESTRTRKKLEFKSQTVLLIRQANLVLHTCPGQHLLTVLLSIFYICPSVSKSERSTYYFVKTI